MTQCMCVDVCVCIYIYIYTYVPIIVHMHTRVHTHVRARYHICACMHTCICTLRYSRIHAHDHLPVHTCLHVDFYRQTPVHIPTYIPSHEITSSASTLQEFLYTETCYMAIVCCIGVPKPLSLTNRRAVQVASSSRMTFEARKWALQASRGQSVGFSLALVTKSSGC